MKGVTDNGRVIETCTNGVKGGQSNVRPSSLVLFSGGLDSTIALAIEKENNKNPVALFINLGQTNFRQEVVAAKKIAYMMNVELITFSLPLNEITNKGVMGSGAMDVPGSGFVPYRNLVLLSIGAVVADQVNANEIVFGVLKDSTGGGYRDTRREFFDQCEKVMQEAIPNDAPKVITPFADKTKKDVWRLAKEMNVMDIAKHSFTCFTGGNIEHEWGTGCGTCRSCCLREQNFVEAFK